MLVCSKGTWMPLVCVFKFPSNHGNLSNMKRCQELRVHSFSSVIYHRPRRRADNLLYSANPLLFIGLRNIPGDRAPDWLNWKPFQMNICLPTFHRAFTRSRSRVFRIITITHSVNSVEFYSGGNIRNLSKFVELPVHRLV